MTKHPRTIGAWVISSSSQVFQGIDAEGNATTLGRGGSDTTGVAIAAALGADECQIYHRCRWRLYH